MTIQDDINNNRAWITYRLQITTGTDNDKNDRWPFCSRDYTGTAYDPYIEYTISPVEHQSSHHGCNLYH